MILNELDAQVSPMDIDVGFGYYCVYLRRWLLSWFTPAVSYHPEELGCHTLVLSTIYYPWEIGVFEIFI